MTESNSNEAAAMEGASLQHRAARTWNKLVIRADSRMTEAVAAYLADISTGGIEISSSDTDHLPGNAGEITFEKITAYIPVIPADFGSNSDSVINELNYFLTNLSRIFPDCSPPEFRTEIIKEEDWGKVWKSHFSSFRITPMLTIKPSWEKPGQQHRDENEEIFVIEMDPGLAFGTGQHASTQLALFILEELFQENKKRLKNILDVGTGSGILAMGCGLFGAERVLAIDNDPDAIETAKRNIIRNRLENIITVSGQNLKAVKPEYNLIVANIIHDTLAEMAEALTGLLAPEGYLVLAGILKGEQENSICDLYTSHGLRCINVLTKDEWAALLFQRD